MKYDIFNVLPKHTLPSSSPAISVARLFGDGGGRSYAFVIVVPVTLA